MEDDKRKRRLVFALLSIILFGVYFLSVIILDGINSFTAFYLIITLLGLIYSLKNYSDLKNEKKERNSPLLVGVVAAGGAIFILLLIAVLASPFPKQR